MSGKQGFTLMEMLVVLLIVATVTCFALPNFTLSTEQAKAQTAKNNLLSIYTAQQNLNNNSGSYNLSFNATACGTSDTNCVATINSALSLNMQDDGNYAYVCATIAGSPSCTATRNSSSPTITYTLTLNAPINLTTVTGGNPSCTYAVNYVNWCV